MGPGLASSRQGMASLYLTKETRLNWPRISRPRAEDYVAKTIDTAKKYQHEENRILRLR